MSFCQALKNMNLNKINYPKSICLFLFVYLFIFNLEAKGIFNFSELTNRYASWAINPTNGRSSIYLKEAWRSFSKKKKEVVVAVVDTGIDPDHPYFRNNLKVLKGNSSRKNYGIDFSAGADNKNQPYDFHGHGTHIAGIIRSVYPHVKLLILKYYNPNASGQDNLDATIKALRFAVKSNVDIINYSGGGPEPSSEEREILKEAERKGILVVAAAGNESSNIDKKQNAFFPASYKFKNIITVTANNQELNILPSSNYGKSSVHLSAPGSRIKAALPKSRVGYRTGTSQATAFVSGVAAFILSQSPNMDLKNLKKIIMTSVSKETSLLRKCLSNGRLNAKNAQNFIQKLNLP